MNPDHPDQQLSSAELDRVERFVVAYNAIKEELARLTDKPEKTSLQELVFAFGSAHRRWRSHDGVDLLEFGEVRNVLVHERNAPYEYLFAPTPLAVERIERMLEHLARPLRIRTALPGRKIFTVRPTASILEVMRLIGQFSFSQFPVYDGVAYHGILATKVIARWFADNYLKDEMHKQIEVTTVADLLAMDEPVDMAFLHAEETVEDVVERFAEHSTLKCVLVTSTGTQAGTLQQIVTRTDVAALLARLMNE